MLSTSNYCLSASRPLSLSLSLSLLISTPTRTHRHIHTHPVHKSCVGESVCLFVCQRVFDSYYRQCHTGHLVNFQRNYRILIIQCWIVFSLDVNCRRLALSLKIIHNNSRNNTLNNNSNNRKNTISNHNNGNNSYKNVNAIKN